MTEHKPRVLVPIGTGFEELEAVAGFDVRADATDPALLVVTDPEQIERARAAHPEAVMIVVTGADDPDPRDVARLGIGDTVGPGGGALGRRSSGVSTEMSGTLRICA